MLNLPLRTKLARLAGTDKRTRLPEPAGLLFPRICQIAKNCRTSDEMIEEYYASHIETRLDAAAINIMRKEKVAKRVANELRSGT